MFSIFFILDVAWILVYKQTVPFVAPVTSWLHMGSPTDPNYSILDQLEQYRSHDGKFKFKIKWPNRSGNNSNIWKQSSNPVTSNPGAPVTGYEAIDVKFKGHHWGGLERSTTDVAFLDGSTNHRWWFYAIGINSLWRGGYPGGVAVAESQTELYVMKVPEEMGLLESGLLESGTFAHEHSLDKRQLSDKSDN